MKKYDKPGALKDILPSEGKRPQGPVQYLYRKI